MFKYSLNCKVMMKISDLEYILEEPKNDSKKLQHNFSHHLFTDDKITKYSAIVNSSYTGLSASAYITLMREDLIDKPKIKFHLTCFPLPKINISKEIVKKYEKIWMIKISELCFEWTINDWNRWNNEGTYGIVGEYRKIKSSLEEEARRKKIEIKDDLINLLTGPISCVRYEFDRYLKNIRKPMIEKGIIQKTIIYSDELEKIRKISPNWDYH